MAVKTMWEKYGGSPAAPSLASAPPATSPIPPAKDAREARPLPLNLAAVRRTLSLTPEEFARPIAIDDGEALITRLQTGFSKPPPTVLDLICEAWRINRK